MHLFSRSGKKNAGAPASGGQSRGHADTDESPPTEERSGLIVLHDCPSSEKEAVDIVAVHGLGGHWKKTWTGASDKLWLRDFLPGQLSDSGIKSRIMSYGYDSDTAFSKSVTDIDDAAGMLLYRLDGDRQSIDEKSRPVVFVAHSLGGIVVKKALILAHERSNYYGHLLRHVRAVVFFGVPHRGAEAAYWANFAARLLQFGQLGFGTNPAYVSALQKNSTTFTDISGQFVERAGRLEIRTFFETEKMGNQLIVDKDSATLQLSNEIAIGIAGSNHRTMCKFDSADSQKYKPVWIAIRTVAKLALDGDVGKQRQPSGDEDRIGTTHFDMDDDNDVRSRSQKTVFSVPFPQDKKFLDRESIFVQIEERLQTEHRIALHGIGGAGKSQVAIEFAYRRRHQNPQTHVFWIYAANETRFVRGYQDVVRKLGLPGADKPEMDQCQLLSDWLDDEDADREWLMILDNADDRSIFSSSPDTEMPSTITRTTPRPLIDYLPRRLDAKKSLIITTRNRDLGQYLSHGETCVEVPLLSPAKALELLQLKLRGSIEQSDSSEVDRLLEILGYLPLAIVQATAFMNRNQISLAAYVDTLEKDEQNLTQHFNTELLDNRRDHEFPNAVFRTWKLSFTQIRSQDPVAAEMLSLMAMLDRQEIPSMLLRSQDQNEIEFVHSLGTLDGYSLVAKGIGGRTVVMHRLVQLSVQYWLNEGKQKERYAGRALKLVTESFPAGEHENKKMCEALLPHAHTVLKHNLASSPDKMHRTTLLYRVGWFELGQGRYALAYRYVFTSYQEQCNHFGEHSYETTDSLGLLGLVLNAQGNYEKAEEMLRRALNLRERELGKEHPSTLTSINNLAGVLQDQGKYEQAEEMYRETLRLMETVLGKEHPSTLMSMDNLAIVLRYQGMYEQAEEMNRETLRLSETVLGKEHPSTLTSMNNLAGVLQNQGMYEQAEEMHRETLRLMETVLDKEHPSTLTSMNNLAGVLQDQGKYEQAEEMHRETLSLIERELGKEHPSTLTSMNNLAGVLRDQGMYEQAEEMHRETLRLKETVLGKEHPSTLTSMNNLAGVLQDQGKYEQAEEMHRRELRLCETVLGKEHPSTLTSINYLAGVLQDQGKYEQAEEMHRETLRLIERELGKEHPSTLTSMDNLAGVLQHQGMYEQAEEMHRETLSLRERELGKEHPSTLASMNNLAGVLRHQGKYEQAEEMHRETLRLMETVLGKEHPFTLTSMNNLALVLQDQGKYEQAEEMHRETLSLIERELGKEHPSTLTSMNNLALVLRHQGKYEQAEEMHRETLRLKETVLGKEHPSTLTSMNNLALVLQHQGKYEQAEEMHRRELRLCETVLGKEHPSTLTSINNLASLLRGRGRLAEAEKLGQKVMQIRTNRPGQARSDSLTSVV